MRPHRSFILVCVIAATLTPTRGRAAYLERAAATPRLTYGNGVAAAGGFLYLFGGRPGGDGSPFDDIRRWDPATGRFDTMATRLPTPRHGLSAVTAGGSIWLFGGFDPTGALDQVLKYDPVADTLVEMSARLPMEGRAYLPGAVHLDGKIYLFGDGSQRILRYDIASDAVSVMNARLDFAGAAVGFSDGVDIYIVGGAYTYPTQHWYDPAVTVHRILRLDVGSDTITDTNRYGNEYGQVAAAWDPVAGSALIVGGNLSGPKAVVSYSPSANVTTELARGSSIIGTSGQYLAPNGMASINGTIYIVQPWDIVRYVDQPGPPQNVKATQTTPGGNVKIDWEPPDPNSHMRPISGYRIYRGNDPNDVGLVSEIPAATTEAMFPAPPMGSSHVYFIAAFTASNEGLRGEAIASSYQNDYSSTTTVSGPTSWADTAASATSSLGNLSASVDAKGRLPYGYVSSSPPAAIGGARVQATAGVSHTIQGVPAGDRSVTARFEITRWSWSAYRDCWWYGIGSCSLYLGEAVTSSRLIVEVAFHPCSAPSACPVSSRKSGVLVLPTGGASWKGGAVGPSSFIVSVPFNATTSGSAVWKATLETTVRITGSSSARVTASAGVAGVSLT